MILRFPACGLGVTLIKRIKNEIVLGELKSRHTHASCSRLLRVKTINISLNLTAPRILAKKSHSQSLWLRHLT